MAHAALVLAEKPELALKNLERRRRLVAAGMTCPFRRRAGWRGTCRTSRSRPQARTLRSNVREQSQPLVRRAGASRETSGCRLRQPASGRAALSGRRRPLRRTFNAALPTSGAKFNAAIALRELTVPQDALRQRASLSGRSGTPGRRRKRFPPAPFPPRASALPFSFQRLHAFVNGRLRQLCSAVARLVFRCLGPALPGRYLAGGCCCPSKTSFRSSFTGSAITRPRRTPPREILNLPCSISGMNASATALRSSGTGLVCLENHFANASSAISIPRD